MGFGDKIKGLRDQAQQAVAENKDKIQGAVQTAAEVANVKTGGKYADKISNVGQKVSTSVDRFADEPAAGGSAPAAGTSTAGAPAAGGASDADGTVVSQVPVAFDEAPAAPDQEAAPKVAPSGAPPEFE